MVTAGRLLRPTAHPRDNAAPGRRPVHVVAARLGHADPSITLRVYAHVINEQLVKAADIFARQINAA
jgi:integrase